MFFKFAFFTFVFFISCNPAKNVVLTNPTLCLNFPCNIKIMSFKTKIPKNLKTKPATWVKLSLYSQRFKSELTGFDKNIKYKKTSVIIILKNKKDSKKIKIDGEKIVTINKKGKQIVYKSKFNLSSCSFKYEGSFYKKTISYNKNSTEIINYIPNSPFLIIDRFPEKNRREWISLFTCFYPVAISNPNPGEILKLNLYGVNSWFFGNKKPELKSNEMIFHHPKKGFVKINSENPVKFLAAIYKHGFLSRKEMLRIWDELLRVGVKPYNFLEIDKK
jgi:hypothetical protein